MEKLESIIASIKETIYKNIVNKLANLFATQRFEKTFDFTRTFVAKANTADSFAIPITNEGPFIQESYNIRFTENSRYVKDGNTVSFCGVKIRFKSQADNAAQSNDYIPVQLISTPGAQSMSRYGARPFLHAYPKADVLIIEYDNRAPEVLNGETYTMADERIEICFNGKIYPVG